MWNKVSSFSLFSLRHDFLNLCISLPYGVYGSFLQVDWQLARGLHIYQQCPVRGIFSARAESVPRWRWRQGCVCILSLECVLCHKPAFHTAAEVIMLKTYEINIASHSLSFRALVRPIMGFSKLVNPDNQLRPF